MTAPAGKSWLEHNSSPAPLVSVQYLISCIQEAERSFTQRGSTGTEKALIVEYTVRVYTMNIPRFFYYLVTVVPLLS